MTAFSEPTQFRLLKFCSWFMFNNNTSDAVKIFKSDLTKISPLDALKVFTWMAQSDYNIQTISNKIDKLTSVFFKPLKNDLKPFPNNHFLISYQYENFALLKRMEEMRPKLREILKSREPSILSEFQKFADTLNNHVVQFQRLEVHVFPLFERVLLQYGAFYRFERIFHNDFKQMLRDIEYLFAIQQFDYTKFNRLVGRLYFRLSLRLYRENLILFPVGCEFIHSKLYQLTFEKEYVE